MKIVKSFEISGVLIKRVSETIKNGPKEQKFGFLGMSLGTLTESVLRNMLAGKTKMSGRQIARTREGVIKTGEGTTRADQGF